MYRVLIVEDEASEAKKLSDLMRRYAKMEGLEFSFAWHSNAMEMLSDKSHYDICFLDIEMPGINGMEAAHLLRSWDDEIPIIFVTNLAKYAVKGYEVGAVGFIVKPVTYGNLKLALSRAMRIMSNNSGQTLTVPTEDGMRVIPFRSIIYIEVTKHSLTYHLEGEEPFDVRGSLSHIEDDLRDAPVVRTGKSFLANMDHISFLNNNEVRMSNGDVLRFGRTYKKSALDKITEYLGSK